MFKGLNLYIPMITQSADMFFSIIFLVSANVTIGLHFMDHLFSNFLC